MLFGHLQSGKRESLVIAYGAQHQLEATLDMLRFKIRNLLRRTNLLLISSVPTAHRGEEYLFGIRSISPHSRLIQDPL